MAAKSTSQTLSALKRSLKSKARADLAETLFKSSDASDLANVLLDHLGEVVRQSEKALKKSGSTLEVSDIGSDKALVLVCMSNRPFIFDSLLAELAEANAQLELVSHPVFETKNGKRSLVAIIIHNNGPVFLKSLKAAVKGTMGQVRHATDDWRKMLTRITDVVSEFRTAPPPLPSDQLAEGIQFLQWLRDDNFIFMGMRQYSWKDGNQAGDLQPDVKSALGILRNPDIAIMTRAGKPVVVSEEIRAFINSETPLIITKANVKTRVHRRAYLDYVGVKQYD